MKKNHKIILAWVLGFVLLIVLNMRRDLRDLSKDMEWVLLERGPLQCSVSNPGVVEAIRVEKIVSEVQEEVVAVQVKEGDTVKKNQAMLILSQTNIKLEYDQKKNSFDEAKINYEKSIRELKIQRKLLRNMAVPKSDVEEAERAVDRAKANLALIKQEYDIVKRKLDSTVSRSPMDGTVLKIHVQEGDKIASGTELVTVGDTSQFIVRTKIDELDIRQVHKDQAAAVLVDAYPDVRFKGRVKSIATQADREAFAKIEVVIAILNPESSPLTHNLSGQVQILTNVIPDAIGIPIKSIQRKQKNTAWVFVKNNINLVREKEITLGQLAGDMVEVKAGLKEGQSVGLFLPNRSRT